MQKKLLQNLHNSLVNSAKQFHLAEADLIEHLQKAEHAKLHLHRGHASMFIYVIEEIKLSEANAYSFIAVARKAREIPELKQTLIQDNVGISKLKRIIPVLNKQNKSEWLSKVKTMTKSELEKEIAGEKPDSKPRESIKRVSKNLTRITTDVEEKIVDKWKRLQDLLSTRYGRSVTLAEAQEFAVGLSLERVDPIQKAERAEIRKAKKEEKQASPTGFPKTNLLCPGTVNSPESNDKNPRQVSAETKHALNLKEGGRCSFIADNGRRCNCRRHLHIHHIKPVSQGGGNELNNLTMLCSNHHRLIHTNCKTTQRAAKTEKLN